MLVEEPRTKIIWGEQANHKRREILHMKLQLKPHLFDIKSHGNPNAHITAIGLLEVTLEAYATAEGCYEVIDDVPDAKTVHAANTRSSPPTPWYVQSPGPQGRAKF